MTALFRIGLVIALAGCLAGCAMPSPRAASVVAPSLQTKPITADQVKGAVTIGESTKADVLAALGETLIIRFDTGFEVWVYKLANDAAAKERVEQRGARLGSEQAASGTSAELVILFAPTGIVAKSRIRPAPQRA